MGAHMRCLNDQGRLVASLAFLVGLASVAAGLAWQYIGGVMPSELAQQQRLCHYLGILVLGIVIIFWRRSRLAWQYVAMAVLIAAFLWSAGLSALQAGIEWGLWPDQAACPNPAGGMWLETLGGIMPIECNVVQLRIFGLSLAGYNALVSLAIALLLVLAIVMRTRGAASQPHLQ